MESGLKQQDVSKVCLDAAAIKRFREEQSLTQLYVSKVVGVTTDTISRWENNRYPTIRRENALKLAEALEVSLDDILQKPAEEVPPAEVVIRKSLQVIWLALAILSLLVLGTVLFFLNRTPPVPAAVTAERVLPPFAGPGSVIPVQISLTQRADNSGIIIREYFPKGWKILQANPPTSSLDNVNGVARWILKAGDNRQRVVYLVQVDEQAKPDGEVSFQGDIVASKQVNQSAIPVRGRDVIAVASVHWADTDGNGLIDDSEMLEGSFVIEEMAGVHMDWEALEKLWDAGGYAWDRQKSRFVPQPRTPVQE